MEIIVLLYLIRIISMEIKIDILQKYYFGVVGAGKLSTKHVKKR